MGADRTLDSGFEHTPDSEVDQWNTLDSLASAALEVVLDATCVATAPKEAQAAYIEPGAP